MNWGGGMRNGRGGANSLDDPEKLKHLLVTLSGKWETPALIAYLADERAHLLLCKAMISPVSDADRHLAQRARKILRSQGIDPDDLKTRLEPAAFALGLSSACDFQIDYYGVLGINQSANSSEIRSAYRKKAFEIHPDTAGDAVRNSADFVTLKAAYDTLLDPKSRAAFDQCQANFDSWHEEETEESPGEKIKRPPSGKLRKACYRVGAVVLALVVMAWVMNLFYERASMLELVEVTSSNPPGKVGEKTEFAGSGAKKEQETIVVPKEDKETPTLVSATKTVEPDKLTDDGRQEKRIWESTEEKKPHIAREVKDISVPASAEVLRPPEVIEKDKDPTPEVNQAISPPPVKKENPTASPVPEPVPATELSGVVAEKKEASVVDDSLKKYSKERPALNTKERRNEIYEAHIKKKPITTESVGLKPTEEPFQQAATKPKLSDANSGVKASPAVKVQTEKPKIHISPKVIAKTPVFPVDTTEKPTPSKTSLHIAKASSLPTFPEIPLPKTHKTSFVKRDQILDFLTKYTATYERGNAETFFSYFMPNATENGKPIKEVQPDYLKIWEKVRNLDYRIILGETEQAVDSDTVLMKGRFKLGWVFHDGQNGQSHGEITMDLKVDDDVLRVSRLDYRFDE